MPSNSQSSLLSLPYDRVVTKHTRMDLGSQQRPRQMSLVANSLQSHHPHQTLITLPVHRLPFQAQPIAHLATTPCGIGRIQPIDAAHRPEVLLILTSAMLIEDRSAPNSWHCSLTESSIPATIMAFDRASETPSFFLSQAS